MNSLVGVLLLVGCGASLPYQDRQVLWKDADDRPVPMPSKSEPSDLWGRSIEPMLDMVDRVLSVDTGSEAVNVNALDEVPDSSWFANRPPLSLAEMATGALPAADPQLPLTVISGKQDGATAGFVVEDARGIKYLIKLDPPGQPCLSTGPDVIGARLYHAAGWHVPSERIIEFDEHDVRISPRATLHGRYQDSRLSLDQKGLDALLAKAGRLPAGPSAGKIRAAAVRFVDGKVLGPWSYLGRRGDDPNDRIAHENRRELRGLVLMAAWINNVDTLDTNTLDAYVGKPGAGYLVHYVIDFGTAFSSYAVRPMPPWMGHESYFDPGSVVASAVGFGVLAPRTWIGPVAEAEKEQRERDWPEIGGFTDEDFDPASWSPLWRNGAFARASVRDRFWAAKQIERIDRERLHVAVSFGRYSPATADHVEEVLWRRRQAVLRYGFGSLAALDRFSAHGGQLCFADLWVEAGLDSATGSSYLIQGTRSDGERPAALRSCVPVERRSGVHEVALRVRRVGARRYGPEVRVYLADGERVVGIERDVR